MISTEKVILVSSHSARCKAQLLWLALHAAYIYTLCVLLKNITEGKTTASHQLVHSITDAFDGPGEAGLKPGAGDSGQVSNVDGGTKLLEPWPAAPGVWNRVELGLTREPRDVACGCLTDILRLSTCLTGRLKGVRTAWRQGWGSLCQVCSREAKVVKSTQPTLSTRHACVMPGMPSRGRKRGPAWLESPGSFGFQISLS